MNHPNNDIYLAAARRQILMDERKDYRIKVEANHGQSGLLARLICLLAEVMIRMGTLLQKRFQSESATTSWQLS